MVDVNKTVPTRAKRLCVVVEKITILTKTRRLALRVRFYGLTNKNLCPLSKKYIQV